MSSALYSFIIVQYLDFYLRESDLWSFLVPLKAAAKPLPRSVLVREMTVNRDLARFVVTLFPEALGSGQAFRTLTGFIASICMDYLSLKKIDEEIVAFILPALTRPFTPDANQDAAVGTPSFLNLLTKTLRSWPAIFPWQHSRNVVA